MLFHSSLVVMTTLLLLTSQENVPRHYHCTDTGPPAVKGPVYYDIWCCSRAVRQRGNRRKSRHYTDVGLRTPLLLSPIKQHQASLTSRFSARHWAFTGRNCNVATKSFDARMRHYGYTNPAGVEGWNVRGLVRGKEKRSSWICIAPHYEKKLPLKCSGMDHTVFTLQTHHACLYLVSLHQTAPPLTIVIATIWLQLTILNYRPQET